MAARHVPLAAALRTLVVVLGVLLAGAGGGRAQAPAPAPPAATQPSADAATRELQDLLATIESDAERARLAANLRALIEARKKAAPVETPPIGARVLAGLTEGAQAASRDVVETVAALRGVPALVGQLREEATDPVNVRRWARYFGTLALVVGAGLLAGWLTRRVTGRVRRLLSHTEQPSLPVRLALALLRAVVEAAPVVAFAAAGYAVVLAADPGPITRATAILLITVNLLVQSAIVLSRVALSPDRSALRLFAASDETANYAHLWTARLAATIGYGIFVGEAARLLGLGAAAYDVYLRALGLAVAAMVAILVLQNRQAVAARIRGDAGLVPRETGFWALRGRLAEVWHVLALIVITVVFFVWALRVRNGFAYVLSSTLLTLVIAAGAALMLRGARRLVDLILSVSPDIHAQYPGLQERLRRYRVVLDSVFRGVVLLIAALLLTEAWGADTFGWITSHVGQRALSVVFTLLVVAAAAVIAWELASSIIERRIVRGGLGVRARTLLPLLLNSIKVVLVVIVALIVLSTFGIDITPLLAGAGVIGLAVGFGSQALVKDVITGFFILMEDQIAVGDVVEVAGKAGLVESISIREVRLRDLDGSVYVVPFGEITTVKNMTKGFSYYLLNISVAYREDTDRVVEVVRELGAEMQADPRYAPLILEPIDVLGVDSFGDSAVVIKARIKTQPIQQWTVGREFNRRMKKRFDAEGIEIPFPQRAIYFSTDKEGRAPPVHVELEGPGVPPAPPVGQRETP